MTIFDINQNEVFVTKVETYPEYSIYGDALAPAAAHFEIEASVVVLRSYLNLTNHYFYRSDPLIPEYAYSASIQVYNNYFSGSVENQLRNLCEYYSYYYPNEYDKNFVGSMMHVISISKHLYGKNVVPNSFYVVEQLPVGGGLIKPFYRFIHDNGSGSLYAGAYATTNAGTVTGSFGKVGNIFYNEGIAFITCSEFLNMTVPPVGPISIPAYVGYNFLCGGGPFGVVDSYNIDFTGSMNTYTKNIFCHLKEYEANFSPITGVYTIGRDAGEAIPGSCAEQSIYGTRRKIFSGSDDRVFITGLGLYDSENKLVGAVKFSQPIRKKENDALMFKLHIDL